MKVAKLSILLIVLMACPLPAMSLATLEFVDAAYNTSCLNGATSIAISPDGNHVYAVGYFSDAVGVFSRDSATGVLTLVEIQHDGVGGVDGLAGAKAVLVSPDGHHVYIAGSSESAISVFSRDSVTGALTYVEMQQNGVNGVSGLGLVDALTISPDGSYVYAAGVNAIAVFSRDNVTGSLAFVEAQYDNVNGVEGIDRVYSIAISPDGSNIYAVGELDDAIAVFARDNITGSLTFVEAQYDGVDGIDGLDGAWSVAVSPDGDHVYVAGYYDDAIAIFSRNSVTGSLTFIETQYDGINNSYYSNSGLYAITISPDGGHAYTAASNDSTIAVFLRDKTTGSLSFLEVHYDDRYGVEGLWGARAVVVSPDNDHIYAAGYLDDAVAIFSIDSDADGINNWEEKNSYGTDPYDSDSDDDGFSDLHEIDRGSDPTDPSDQPAAIRIYVDIDASGGNDGSSWEDAYTTLQDALAAVYPKDQIWVAGGIYYPDEGVGQIADNRYSVFSIPSGVSLYGGFDGTDGSGGGQRETQLSQRDWEDHVTILSGDLDQDGDRDGNASHVVFFDHVSDQTILDGITITSGYAENGGGGGIYNDGSGESNSSNPQLFNCTIRDNVAYFDGGGGMFNDGRTGGTSCPILTNCKVIGNNAFISYGGGIYNFGDGGTSSPELINCIISGNEANEGGGGIYNYSADGGASNPILTNCVISGNYTDHGGGGGIYNYSVNGGTTSPIFTNCTISGNNVPYGGDGGGTYSVSDGGISTPQFINCIVWNNQVSTESSGPEIYNVVAEPLYTYCDIKGSGGSSSWNTSLGTDNGSNIDADPFFMDTPDYNNAPTVEGDMHLQMVIGSPCVDIGDNFANAEPLDLAGETRIQNGTIELGAYEVSDLDGDGISDWEEVTLYETNPSVADTDDDSINDGDELKYWRADWDTDYDNDVATYANNLLDPDSDGDEISDGEEINTYSTDPSDWDTDDDGLSDGNELAYWGDGWDDNYDKDAIANNLLDFDSDNDGFGDAHEILRGSDPTDPNSNPPKMYIYVDVDATGSNDGTSWVNAYTDLQDALVGPVFPGDQVWVAGGTYCPDEGAGQIDDDRNSTFKVTSGVTLYGGFGGTDGAGGGDLETRIGQRDWKTHKTVLSGDITQNAIDVRYNHGNTYHVVSFNGVNTQTIMDGFTITAGRADGSGSSRFGGGIYCNSVGNGNSSTPQLKNCILSGNYAFWGGGIGNDGSNGGSSSPTLINCVISGNYAEYGGGGVYNSGSGEGSSAPVLVNCTISGNCADYTGGGMLSVAEDGSSQPILINCIVWNNQADMAGSEIYNISSAPVYSYCDINGSNGSGALWNGGLGVDNGYNIDIDPLFQDTPDPSLAPSTAGDIHLQPGSPCIDVGDSDSLSLPTIDIDGEARDSNCDIGADEFVDNSPLPIGTGGGGGGGGCFITSLECF